MDHNEFLPTSEDVKTNGDIIKDLVVRFATSIREKDPVTEKFHPPVFEGKTKLTGVQSFVPIDEVEFERHHEPDSSGYSDGSPESDSGEYYTINFGFEDNFYLSVFYFEFDDRTKASELYVTSGFEDITRLNWDDTVMPFGNFVNLLLNNLNNQLQEQG